MLTNPKVFGEIGTTVAGLKKSAHFKSSLRFWGDEAVPKNPKVGGNRALVHHLTSALTAGEIMKALGGFVPKDIDRMQPVSLGDATIPWAVRSAGRQCQRAPADRVLRDRVRIPGAGRRLGLFTLGQRFLVDSCDAR